jgi:hypothetical protein
MRMPATCQQSAVNEGSAIGTSAFHTCPTLRSGLFYHYFLTSKALFAIWSGIGMIEASLLCLCGVLDAVVRYYIIVKS